MPETIEQVRDRVAEKRGASVPAERSRKPRPQEWKAGESGNPNGRPTFREELEGLLAEMDDVRGKRKTRVLVEAWYEMAARGSVQAMLGLWDRLEGAPKQTVDVTLHDADKSEADLQAEYERLCAAVEATDRQPARGAKKKAAPVA